MKIQPRIIISKVNRIEVEKVNELLPTITKSDLSVKPSQIFTIDTTEDKSIGIEEIKELMEWCYVKLSEPRLIIIQNAHRLTDQAQNSLLKLLEEPPEFLIILLVTNQSESLLVTIRSRCMIVELEEESKNIFNSKEVEDFLKGDISSRLKIVDSITNSENPKQQALALVENILASEKNPANVDLLIKVHKGILAQSSVKLGLELLSYSL